MTNNFTPKKASDNRPKLSKEEYAEKKKSRKGSRLSDGGRGGRRNRKRP